MFYSLCPGIRPLASSAGVAVLLAISACSVTPPSTPEVVPLGAAALQPPMAPPIPAEKVLEDSEVSTHPSTNAAALASASTRELAQKAPNQIRPTGSVPSTSKPAAISQWEVKTSDITLYRTLERWSHAAGYKLKWDASKNFLIGAPDVYTGSFESAIQSVLSSAGIRLSDYPLEACIYTNTPPLVRITRQGQQARECSAVE